MRRTAALVLVWSALAAPVAQAARSKTNQLLRVITPVARSTAHAHPFVNVVVRFGTVGGVAADIDTFKARLGRTDVTADFTPFTEKGAVAGMRAKFERPRIRISRRAVNRLRLEVRSLPRTGTGPRVVKDVDRVRFRAMEAPNQPPVAGLVPPGELIFPDIPVQFDASPSQDPDLDQLTYTWDFGDGETSTEVQPVHVFSGRSGDVTVRLTVSDGALTASDQETLVECPEPDADRTAGLLRIESTDPLEFGPVTPGTSVPRTLTIVNPDPTPTSQLRVRLRVDGAGFSASPDTFDLGPGASAPLTVTFAPTAEGHRSADIVVVGSGSNRCVAHVVAHGYGGAGAGSGPTTAAQMVFHNVFGSGTAAVMPTGARIRVDNNVHTCQTPNNGPGTGDFCLVDQDCAANGGSCNTAVSTLLDPVDMCSDGAGGLFLMSDEGSYTDPNPNAVDDHDVTVLRLSLDADGNRTGADILARETSGTSQIGCDGIAPSAGGRLYVPEFHSVSPPECFRSELESLISIRKGSGASDVILPRIDAAEGLDACNDDIDQVSDLNVTADGLAVYASFSDGGLYQLRPSFRPITPSIVDAFQLHPDGDIVFVTASDSGTTGLIRVYKIAPEQAVNGAILLSDLTPCAVLKVPNNRGGPNNIGRTSLGEHSFAVGPASLDSDEGTLLVSFVTTGAVNDPEPALASRLGVRGTVAFAMPAGVPTCSTTGFVSLDFFDSLTF